MNDFLEEAEDCPLRDDGLPEHLWPKLEAARENLTDEQWLKLYKLLIEFADIFSRRYSDIPKAEMEQMRIPLRDGATAQTCRSRHMNPKQSALIREYAEKLLKSGVLEKSDSEWRSNVLMVPKPDCTWRVTLDFRQINRLTKPIASNLPSLAGCLDQMGGKKIFSTMDILSAYWSCELYEPHRKYTAFHAPGLGNL